MEESNPNLLQQSAPLSHAHSIDWYVRVWQSPTSHQGWRTSTDARNGETQGSPSLNIQENPENRVKAMQKISKDNEYQEWTKNILDKIEKKGIKRVELWSKERHEENRRDQKEKQQQQQQELGALDQSHPTEDQRGQQQEEIQQPPPKKRSRIEGPTQQLHGPTQQVEVQQEPEQDPPINITTEGVGEDKVASPTQVTRTTPATTNVATDAPDVAPMNADPAPTNNSKKKPPTKPQQLVFPAQDIREKWKQQQRLQQQQRATGKSESVPTTPSNTTTSDRVSHKTTTTNLTLNKTPKTPQDSKTTTTPKPPPPLLLEQQHQDWVEKGHEVPTDLESRRCPAKSLKTSQDHWHPGWVPPPPPTPQQQQIHRLQQDSKTQSQPSTHNDNSYQNYNKQHFHTNNNNTTNNNT